MASPATCDSDKSIAPFQGGPAMRKKKRKKLHGTVLKVLKPIVPKEPEKAEISVHEADDLYREIRIENVLTDENGEKVRLKPGAEVDVVLEADTDATTKKLD
jgi:predicted DNA-binding antitoxin AbrB/MazE fold protein